MTDSVDLILDSFRKTNLYSTPAKLEEFARSFKDCIDLNSVKKKL